MAKTFDKIAAQGDLMFIRIDSLPNDAVLQDAKNGEYVASHSETGHKHIIRQCEDVKFYLAANDNMRAYLVVNKDGPLIEHMRDFDTHEPIAFKQGIYEIRRQREYTPEGWRVALD
jgi:hypothetical protein